MNNNFSRSETKRLKTHSSIVSASYYKIFYPLPFDIRCEVISYLRILKFKIIRDRIVWVNDKTVSIPDGKPTFFFPSELLRAYFGYFKEDRFRNPYLISRVIRVFVDSKSTIHPLKYIPVTGVIEHVGINACTSERVQTAYGIVRPHRYIHTRNMHENNPLLEFELRRLIFKKFLFTDNLGEQVPSIVKYRMDDFCSNVAHENVNELFERIEMKRLSLTFYRPPREEFRFSLIKNLRSINFAINGENQEELVTNNLINLVRYSLQNLEHCHFRIATFGKRIWERIMKGMNHDEISIRSLEISRYNRYFGDDVRGVLIDHFSEIIRFPRLKSLKTPVEKFTPDELFNFLIDVLTFSKIRKWKSLISFGSHENHEVKSAIGRKNEFLSRCSQNFHLRDLSIRLWGLPNNSELSQILFEILGEKALALEKLDVGVFIKGCLDELCDFHLPSVKILKVRFGYSRSYYNNVLFKMNDFSKLLSVFQCPLNELNVYFFRNRAIGNQLDVTNCFRSTNLSEKLEYLQIPMKFNVDLNDKWKIFTLALFHFDNFLREFKNLKKITIQIFEVSVNSSCFERNGIDDEREEELMMKWVEFFQLFSKYLTGRIFNHSSISEFEIVDVSLESHEFYCWNRLESESNQHENFPTVLDFCSDTMEIDKDSQYLLGSSYRIGSNGVQKNMKKAIHWFTRSCEGGNLHGYKVIVMILLSDGYHQDFEKGTKWLKVSAESGNVEHMVMLAEFYLGVRENPCISIDFKRALYWYQKAHESVDDGSEEELVVSIKSGIEFAQSKLEPKKVYKFYNKQI